MIGRTEKPSKNTPSHYVGAANTATAKNLEASLSKLPTDVVQKIGHLAGPHAEFHLAGLSRHLRAAFAPQREAFLISATTQRLNAFRHRAHALAVSSPSFAAQERYEDRWLGYCFYGFLTVGVDAFAVRARDSERATAARLAYGCLFGALIGPALMSGAAGLGTGVGLFRAMTVDEPDVMSRYYRHQKRTRMRYVINTWPTTLPKAPKVVKSALARGDVAGIDQLNAFFTSEEIGALKMKHPERIAAGLSRQLKRR